MSPKGREAKSEPCDPLGFLPRNTLQTAAQEGGSQAEHGGLFELKGHRLSYAEAEEAGICEAEFQRRHCIDTRARNLYKETSVESLAE